VNTEIFTSNRQITYLSKRSQAALEAKVQQYRIVLVKTLIWRIVAAFSEDSSARLHAVQLQASGSSLCAARTSLERSQAEGQTR
jgi:hypothetical protein